jgi:hypothetical protein
MRMNGRALAFARSLVRCAVVAHRCANRPLGAVRLTDVHLTDHRTLVGGSAGKRSCGYTQQRPLDLAPDADRGCLQRAHSPREEATPRGAGQTPQDVTSWVATGVF